MPEEIDAAYYFRNGRLRPGLDFTHDRKLMRAAILEWFGQNPGPRNLTVARDAVNCGDFQVFNEIVLELVEAGVLRRAGEPVTPAFSTLYNHAAVTVDAWLKATARRREAACTMKEASDASD